MKELKRMLIYFLLIVGSVVMLAPFAWMVVTSFKLPSEVNTWPPRWTTRSFATSRTVKVVPTTGSATIAKGLSLREALTFVAKKSEGLVLNVNDDPFYRGTLRIPFKGATYTAAVTTEKFSQFLEKLEFPKEFPTDSPEVFFENVYLHYILGASPYFKRDTYIETILNSIESLADMIDTMLTFAVDRIEDESERDRFANFLEKKLEELEKVKPLVQRYKAGEELILSQNELTEIQKILNSLDLVYTTNSSHEVIDNYNSAIRNGLGNQLKHLEFFLAVDKFFKEVQDRTAGKDVVAQPLTEEDKRRILIERTQHFKDASLIKELVEKLPLDNIPEEFSKFLDKDLEKKYGITGIELANLKSLVGSLVNLAYEHDVDPEIYLADKDGSFARFESAVENAVGFNLTFVSVRSKLQAYREEFKNADELFRDVALNALELQDFRTIFENTRYAWKLIEAPEFVKSVLVKEGKSIEVVMEGVSPIYFIDDGIRKVELKFSASDVVKNVFQNYALAWKAAPFGRYYANTVFIAVVTTILEIIVSAMAAYAFSWMQFPGRGILFSIFLATMMVPGEVLLVPNFITVTKFGWIDTYYALIIPWIVSVFSIFLMRQHFLSLPLELFDAAKIDGCSHWRFLWQIAVPLSKPVVVTSALLKFVGSWNAFLWVLIVTNSPKYRTLTVGLQTFSSEVGTLYNMLMAAATFSILPVVIIFLFTQKYFVRGIARTGLK
ncbi:carbohydrate ABC transporter permease [Fervidobacterium thailandense]|uniref:ATPase n=1 Tax=Fervidobacterium thailandense TaxID=1008305 RepID=A0A1E3G4X6_9BACT|nr:carbohydrate ABC transporter permease [Fervidobacterium thailandense]ODN30893.1 ATPase [Fervidobacterium thailandense]